MPSYQKFLKAAMAERGPEHPIWEVNDKMAGRELGHLADLHVPEVYAGPASIRAFEPPAHDVVIKPLNGCSARGIVPLKYDGDGQYFNMFTQQDITWDQAVNKALADKHTPRNLRLVEQGHPDALRPPWILEELILNDKGELPCNWKAFCFGGRVVAIYNSYALLDGTSKIKWWTRDFKNIGDICPAKKWKYHKMLRRPNNPEGMIRGFEDIAELIDSPFIRVDLYERGNQIVFGEVTPHPTGGGQLFVPEWDEIFGQAWADALNEG